jgi:hypothetical protein
MKRQGLMFLSILSLLATLGVPGLRAQTLDHLIKANVPFHFVVGNQTLPAGAYRVAQVGEPGVFLIASDDARAAAIITTRSTSFNKPQKQTVLRFNRYGDEYFLSQLWIEGEVSGEELAKSKMEGELTKAQNAATPDEQINIAGL